MPLRIVMREKPGRENPGFGKSSDRPLFPLPKLLVWNRLKDVKEAERLGRANAQKLVTEFVGKASPNHEGMRKMLSIARKTN